MKMRTVYEQQYEMSRGEKEEEVGGRGGNKRFLGVYSNRRRLSP